MTFLELCQLARQECGIQGSNKPSSVSSQVGILSRVVQWVATSDLMIQGLYPDWNFLWGETTMSTVTGSKLVPLTVSPAIWDTESFAFKRGESGGRKLTYIPYREWRSNNSEKENQEPNKITVLPDNTLSLEYPSDGAYDIYACYWAVPTKLTANTDEPVYAERFQQIIIERVKMFYFKDIESYDQFQLAEQEYNELLDKMRGQYLPDQINLHLTSPERIVIRPI